MDYKELDEYTRDLYKRVSRNFITSRKYFILYEEQNLLQRNIYSAKVHLDLLESMLLDCEGECIETRNFKKRRSALVREELETLHGKHNVVLEFIRRIEDGL